MFGDKIQINGKLSLRELRGLTGMNQEEFAHFVGIPVTSYRRYERDTSSMEFGRVVQICDKLGISVAHVAC